MVFVSCIFQVFLQYIYRHQPPLTFHCYYPGSWTPLKGLLVPLLPPYSVLSARLPRGLQIHTDQTGVPSPPALQWFFSFAFYSGSVRPGTRSLLALPTQLSSFTPGPQAHSPSLRLPPAGDMLTSGPLPGPSPHLWPLLMIITAAPSHLQVVPSQTFLSKATQVSLFF